MDTTKGIDAELVRQLEQLGQRDVPAAVLLPAARKALEHRKALEAELQTLRGGVELARLELRRRGGAS